MVKVHITSHDPILHIIYDKEKCEEYFGDDFLDEYGVEISEELYLEYKKSYGEFISIQDKISNFLKENK